MSTSMSEVPRNQPSADFLRLGHCTRTDLEAIMRQGRAPDLNLLVGREYRGMNLGIGPRILALRKFIKGFCRSTSGAPVGYNLRALQNSPAEPWRAKSPREARGRFGFFRLLTPDPMRRENAYLDALVLDYGQGSNRRFAATSLLRDYVVRVRPDSDDLLLGKAFLAVGDRRLQIGYFLLERQGLALCEPPPNG